MSKVKLLIDVISDMRSLANSLEAVAEAMVGAEDNLVVDQIEKQKEAALEKVEPPNKKEVTLEAVRALLAEKSRDGFTAEVRDIIQKYGGTKLSEIDSEHFVNILTDAEALGNEE